MKSLYLLFTILLFYGGVHAQGYNQIKQFINQAYSDGQLLMNHEAIGGGIVYRDSVGPYAIEKMFYAFKDLRNTVILKYNPYGHTKKPTDSLVLTINEQDFIKTKIAKMTDFKWSKNLLPNSKMIPSDTVRKIFADHKYNGWNVMRDRGIGDFYTFGTPIFLRNNTYCLFYYGHSCGNLCGAGEFSLFKKINGKWRYLARLSSWVS